MKRTLLCVLAVLAACTMLVACKRSGDELSLIHILTLPTKRIV